MPGFLKYSKKLEIFMSLVLLMSVSLIACNMNEVVEDKKETESVTTKKTNGKVVVIDPGHGGADPGKVGINDAKEKDVNLAIGMELKSVLEDAGFEVVMTREEDTNLGSDGKFSKVGDLNARCSIINQAYEKNKECVLVSIHQNSFTSESVHGAQTFYYQRSENSMKLAEIAQNKFNQEINTEKAKKAKPNDSYYMLINSKCPGIIVECGFLSNREEADKLIEQEYQRQLSEIICDCIKEYFVTVQPCDI